MDINNKTDRFLNEVRRIAKYNSTIGDEIIQEMRTAETESSDNINFEFHRYKINEKDSSRYNTTLAIKEKEYFFDITDEWP